MSRSLAGYLEDFLEKGNDYAYTQSHGYRTVRWTYRQVAQTAYRVARELEARAICKGDRVLLWAPNSAEWVAVFFGCVVLGVVVVPMDDAAAPDFALRVTRQVGAKLAVCSREHVAEFSLPTMLLEDLPELLDAAFFRGFSVRCERTARHAGNHLHLGHHGRAQGSGDYPWQRFD